MYNNTKFVIKLNFKKIFFYRGEDLKKSSIPLNLDFESVSGKLMFYTQNIALCNPTFKILIKLLLNITDVSSLMELSKSVK